MTEDDLLQALSAAIAPKPTDDPGLTVHELAVKLYGKNSLGNRNKVTARLHLLKAENRLKIGKRMAERLAGTMYPLTVYSIIRAKR